MPASGLCVLVFVAAVCFSCHAVSSGIHLPIKPCRPSRRVKSKGKSELLANFVSCMYAYLWIISRGLAIGLIPLMVL